MRGFIKQRSLVFRALLNPPIATLRIVSVIFSLRHPEVEKRLNMLTEPKAGLELIWGLFSFIDFKPETLPHVFPV